MFESAGYKGFWNNQKHIISSLLFTETENYFEKTPPNLSK